MLQEKDLLDVYDKFVQAIADERTTRGMTGRWKDQEFNSVLDQFRDDFAAKGVKVAFCKRKSLNGHRRWLEFIDVEKSGGSYVPQFDIDNMSGQVINTCWTKLEFPNGVGEFLCSRCTHDSIDLCKVFLFTCISLRMFSLLNLMYVPSC